MNIKSQRGEVLTIVLVVLGLCGATQLVPNWRVNHWFAKKPPMVALADAQAQLEKAKADAAAKEAALLAAQAAERTKMQEQVRSAQQTNEGAAAALSRVPAEHRTAEVKLAASMSARTSIRLAAAVGKLPDDMRDEILLIVDQALSDKQAEVDAANASLAKKDKDFAALTAERESIKAQIPVLQKKADDAVKAKADADAIVTAKTTEVVQYATQLHQEKEQNGSLQATVEKYLKGAMLLGLGYVLLAFVLPAIVKVMDAGPLKNTLRNVSGYILNPVLHHDAKKKIATSTPTST